MNRRRMDRPTPAALAPISRNLLLPLIAIGFSGAVAANPTGATPVAGVPTITVDGNTLTVATTGRTIINWNSFSIGQNENTRFDMSGADRAVLNRVINGGARSEILGRLEGNGSIYLINPNGVLIGMSGVVQTQSFIASTREVTDANFLSGGELTFTGAGAGEIENLGVINATVGDVALIGKRVVNDTSGVITASQGIVALAAGDEVVLAQPGSSRLFVRVDGIAPDTAVNQVDHQGTILAAQAELQAVGGNMYGLAVNATGPINATGISNREGRIFLTAPDGRIAARGVLSARNADGSGGLIDIDAGNAWPSEVNVSGTLDVSSPSSGGALFIDGGYVDITDSAQLLASGDSKLGGVINVGTRRQANHVGVGSSVQISANSSLDAGAITLSGADVDFSGTAVARGIRTLGSVDLNGGETLEVTGLADLRAYGDTSRFGTLRVSATDADFTIASSGSGYLNLLDAGALQNQLGYAHVDITSARQEGSINVLAPLSWTAATRLSLDSRYDVRLNNVVQAPNGSLRLISREGSVSDQETASTTVHELWTSAADRVWFSRPLSAEKVTLYDVKGPTLLDSTQNRLGSVTFIRDLIGTGGSVYIADDADGLSLSVQNIGVPGYATTGNFTVMTVGDLTLEDSFRVQVGGDVTLVASGGVFRNRSSAGAELFGTSANGLGRTRIYSRENGEPGGLTGESRYGVSHPEDPDTGAKTVFYYSSSAPPADPSPTPDPDPTPDPGGVPAGPQPPKDPFAGLVPTQIVQIALNGNTFDQLQQVSPRSLRITTSPPDEWRAQETPKLEELARKAYPEPSESSTTKTSQTAPAPNLDSQMDRLVQLVSQVAASQPQGLGDDVESILATLRGSGQLDAIMQQVEQILQATPSGGRFSTSVSTGIQQYLNDLFAANTLDPRNSAPADRLRAQQQVQNQADDLANIARQAADQQRTAAIASFILGIMQSGLLTTDNTQQQTGTPPPPQPMKLPPAKIGNPAVQDVMKLTPARTPGT